MKVFRFQNYVLKANNYWIVSSLFLNQMPKSVPAENFAGVCANVGNPTRMNFIKLMMVLLCGVRYKKKKIINEPQRCLVSSGLICLTWWDKEWSEVTFKIWLESQGWVKSQCFSWSTGANMGLKKTKKTTFLDNLPKQSRHSSAKKNSRNNGGKKAA